MPSKQLIWTLVGVQPTPRCWRLASCSAGKALPRTLPARSQVAAKINDYFLTQGEETLHAIHINRSILF